MTRHANDADWKLILLMMYANVKQLKEFNLLNKNRCICFVVLTYHKLFGLTWSQFIWRSILLVFFFKFTKLTLLEYLDGPEGQLFVFFQNFAPHDTYPQSLQSKWDFLCNRPISFIYDVFPCPLGRKNHWFQERAAARLFKSSPQAYRKKARTETLNFSREKMKENFLYDNDAVRITKRVYKWAHSSINRVLMLVLITFWQCGRKIERNVTFSFQERYGRWNWAQMMYFSQCLKKKLFVQI